MELQKKKGTDNAVHLCFVRLLMMPMAVGNDGCRGILPTLEEQRKSPPTGYDASVGFHFERSRTRSAPLVISRFLPAITTADPTSRFPWQRSRDPSAWNHRVTLGSPLSALKAQCAIFGWICDFYIRKSLTYCSKCMWFFQPLELLSLIYKNLHRATVFVQVSCHQRHADSNVRSRLNN